MIEFLRTFAGRARSPMKRHACRTRIEPAWRVMLAVFFLTAVHSQGQEAGAHPIGSHAVPILTVNGLRFRDLDRDGKLSPFEDWRMPAEVRAEDLLSRLSLEEKAGLMMHGTLPANGSEVSGSGAQYDLKQASGLILGKQVTTFITRLSVPAGILAAQNNKVQELAEQARYAIPLTISTDPRNAFSATLGASNDAADFTKWPGPLGLAATGDPAVTEKFAQDTRREYVAVGIREALSPQADLATEPRWPRIDGTFGEDADLVGRMVHAFIAGFQAGDTGLHTESVSCVVKHWVGYGAAKDGWDSHNIYGKRAVFSGNALEEHTRPFLGAFSAQVAAVMPTYSILTNASFREKRIEPVGAAMNRGLLNDLLRGTFAFRGVIISDWLVTSDCAGQCVNGAVEGTAPAIVPGRQGMPWGVESLSVKERYAKAIDAGIDQFGGVTDTDIVVALVRTGEVSPERVDASARRILVQKFELGLFENPFVDETAAQRIVGNPLFQKDSREAQHRSMVLLRNEQSVLPLAGAHRKVALYGFSEQVARAHGLIPVGPGEKPDFALVRMHAPFEALHPQFFFGSRQHEGDLDFKASDPQLQAFQQLAKKCLTIVSLYLDRPAVLTQLAASASAIVVDFGASEDTIFDVITGVAAPGGHLPFELPSSMEAVRAQRSDLPHDSGHPLYPIYSGLSFPLKSRTER